MRGDKIVIDVQEKEVKESEIPPDFDSCIFNVDENVAISFHVFKSLSCALEPTGILNLVIVTYFLIFVLTKMVLLSSSYTCLSCLSTHTARHIYIN